jgi:RNase P subunit RPR2
MPTSWEYPGSRIKGRLQCNLCERGGFFGSNSWVELTDSTGKITKYLRQTCPYCGNTRLFDIEKARSVRYHDPDTTEIFPEE